MLQVPKGFSIHTTFNRSTRFPIPEFGSTTWDGQCLLHLRQMPTTNPHSKVHCATVFIVVTILYLARKPQSSLIYVHNIAYPQPFKRGADEEKLNILLQYSTRASPTECVSLPLHI